MARVLVTGSTTGLGLAAARQLLDEGHEVVLHARSEARAADLADVAPRSAGVVIGDLASAAETRGVVYGLHLGRFADTVVRWAYFLVSLAGTAMVGTGLVLWTVKRRARLPDPDRPHFGFRLVERLNVATVAGLPLAMAAFLWGNRVLPVGVTGRADWEVHLFFIVWALALAYAAVRPPKQAWIELLWLAAASMALLPVLNALTTRRPFWHSVATHDWVYAGFDLAMWAFAALHAMFAIYAARCRPRPQALRVPRVLARDERA